MEPTEIHQRLERLDASVADIRETLGQIKGQLCAPKTVHAALKEPQTMLIALLVFMATTSGQSVSQLLAQIGSP